MTLYLCMYRNFTHDIVHNSGTLLMATPSQLRYKGQVPNEQCAYKTTPQLPTQKSGFTQL